MPNKPDSPAKAQLRAFANKLRTSGPNYATMTNKQLAYLRQSARDWLEDHPDNTVALKRYDLLVEEMEVWAKTF